jgi:hypothetical protein
MAIEGSDCAGLLTHLPDEAADGLAHDAVARVVGAVGKAPLAPRIVGVALDHGPVLVGQHGDRAEVVLMEVAQGDARALQEAHAHHGAAHHDVVVPLGGGGDDELDVHPEGVEIARGRDRRPLHHGLFVALMVDVVGEV